MRRTQILVQKMLDESPQFALMQCSGCETDDRYPVIVAASDAPLLNTAYNGSGGFLTSGTDLHWEVGNPAILPRGHPSATVFYFNNAFGSPNPLTRTGFRTSSHCH